MTHTSFLKTIFLVGACALVLVSQAAQVDAESTRPPNIVVILVDDMGWSDLGCYGSEISTPNVDALAANGLRFTQFYNSARCSPTRASLITGLYPHQAGMGYLDDLVRPNSKGTQGRLRNDCVTIGEVLQDAGYFTIMTGKWHMGLDKGTPPWKRGFMRSLASRLGAIYFPDQAYNASDPLYLNGEAKPLDDPAFGDAWYGPDLITEWGLKFIDEARAEKKPFFLYLAHSSSHFPLMAPQEDIARYRGKYLVGWDKLREARFARQVELGLVDAKWKLSPRPPDVPAWNTRDQKHQERFDTIMSIYAAVLDRMDRSVGTLVDGLRERGELDNTLIFFLADNGGNAEAGPAGRLRGEPPGGPKSTVFLGQNWATLANTPFRRYKHFTHEGGISTPLVVHWPAGIPRERNGKLENQPGHLIDIMATAVAASSAKYPTDYRGQAVQPMEGVSLLPALVGEPLNRQSPLYFEHEGNRAIRRGKWKLVMKYKGPWELYDVEADRTEQNNRIGYELGLANELAADWEAWAKRADVDQWTGPGRRNSGELRRPRPNRPATQPEAATPTSSSPQ